MPQALRLAQADAIDDGGVIQLVGDHGILRRQQRLHVAARDTWPSCMRTHARQHAPCHSLSLLGERTDAGAPLPVSGRALYQ